MSKPKPLPEYVVINGVCRLDVGPNATTWPWPFLDDYHSTAAHRARYSPALLTRTQFYELASMADAYSTLITHPCRSVRETLHVLHRVYEAEEEKDHA